MLAPLLIEGMLDQLGLDGSAPVKDARLMSIGSIHMEFRSGDVVWGSGANGFFLDRLGSTDLDVRAVRGPLSRRFLLEQGVAPVPEVYGDPAALLPQFRPELFSTAPRFGALFVPHFHESSGIFHQAIPLGPVPSGINVQLPTRPFREVLSAISSSEFVCASSLHAVMLAEACGIPARVVVPVHEPRFKYDDYYEGTGRTYEPATSLDKALELGGQAPPIFDAQALIDAFPADLWRPVG
jgi:pyruvyltransferase